MDISKLSSLVLTRFLTANLEVGRKVFTQENLKIHRFQDLISITDMTFAGKRGKTVKTLSVIPEKEELSDKILKQAISSILGMNYAQAKAKLESLQDQYPNLFTLSEKSARGVDVEPMGTTIELEKKLPDGSKIRVTASPHDFTVVKSALFQSPNKPGQGFMHDTSYFPRSKQDGIVFYAWIKDNLSKASNMTIDDFRKVWSEIGVKYDTR